jgi:hypothetical protein
MELKDKTIDELKIIGFDIDQQIKASQHNYQIVINLINEKLQNVPVQPKEDGAKKS